MKILIVRMYQDVLKISNYNSQEIGLAKALIRKGHHCDIVLYTDKKEVSIQKINMENGKTITIYWMPGKKILKNCIYDKRLYELAKKYDVIQSTEYDQVGNLKLQKVTDNHMVIYHGPYQSYYPKTYKRKCLMTDFLHSFFPQFKNVQLIAKSTMAEKFLNKKGFKKVETIGVGLDTVRFEKIHEPNETVKKLLNEKNEKRYKYLLYIGKIEDRRNILFMIDILSKLSLEDKNIRLVLIGKGEKYLKKCLNYARSLNVHENVIYHDPMKQEELANVYRCCDIFLFPSKYEIFGMVLLEAMYFGLPTITTMNGGSSTLIKDKNTGIICDLNNLNSWCEAIINLLNNQKLRDEISVNSSRLIKENYTWDALSDKFLKVYESTFSKSNENQL
ncbi:MAG: glycosyltransferase family 4 protein [Syntrophaceae bacterium]|nr:glycosyltransferase family 4 protein [Syntrophaceae bacterium]